MMTSTLNPFPTGEVESIEIRAKTGKDSAVPEEIPILLTFLDGLMVEIFTSLGSKSIKVNHFCNELVYTNAL